MNFFNITPNILVVEESKDVAFVKTILNDEQEITIGKNYYIPKNSKVYIVKPLDTISSIAKKLNVDEEVIYKKIKSKNVFIGQKILLD